MSSLHSLHTVFTAYDCDVTAGKIFKCRCLVYAEKVDFHEVRLHRL